MNQNVEKMIAKDLLSISAVFLRPDEPFTWASGIKSPIYCDNRLTLTAPAVRTDVETALKAVIEEYYPDVEVLMGTSTAGIAHAAITAHLMNLPMGYVRSGHKDHGRGNQIEGKLEKGQKVVVVEDLISTGGSVLRSWTCCAKPARRFSALRLSSPTECRRGLTVWQRQTSPTTACPTSTCCAKSRRKKGTSSLKTLPA